MLSRLIYASEAVVDLNPAILDDLLARARTKNRLLDITGLLLFDSRYFLQVLEGEREKISALYARLLQDPRHQRVALLRFEEIDQRFFGSWKMGFVAANAATRPIFLRYGSSSRFDPYTLTGAAALGVLREIGYAVTPDPLETELYVDPVSHLKA